MSLRTFGVALGAALVFSAGTVQVTQAQTPTSSPVPVTPLAPSPQLMPVMPPVAPVAAPSTVTPTMAPQVVMPVMPPTQTAMPAAPVRTLPPGQTAIPGLTPQPEIPLLTTQDMTSPVLPPTLTDSKAGSAVVLLDRIQTLVEGALGVSNDPKADKPVHQKKLGESGTVNMDRASLDEIQSLAAQVAAMFPPRPQP